MRIYVSPSTQDTNSYAGGSNEEVQMRRVSGVVVDALRASGHEARIGGNLSARTNADEGNAWGAELYVAIHSNAGGGTGTEAWYYPGSDKGRALAMAVYDRVARLSPMPDRGVKSDAKYVELNRPKAPACIIEVAFHDNAAEAAWIRDNTGPLGLAIAEGVLAIAGGSVSGPYSGRTLAAVADVREERLQEYRDAMTRLGFDHRWSGGSTVIADAEERGRRLQAGARVAANILATGEA